tara:strand:+ start:3943 stop:5019 length:1077 start_codon:yes stop_codon:yes gene_type:complete
MENNNFNINNIKKHLGTINYPGFNRDIISFGMVKDISIENNNVNILLQINSDNQEHLKQLELQIINKLNIEGVSRVQVEFQKSSKHPTAITSEEDALTKQSIPNVKNIIAIASGKGGVGKSTVAINLATTLSNTYKTGLLDLDIYGPSLPTLVGENAQPNMNESKKLIPIEKYNLKLMSFGFINSQNAPAIWRGPMVARMTQQFFEDVEWGNLDFLILDLPPGTGDIQLTLVQKLALTGAIMVTTPQKLAVMDVKKGADMFKKVNTPLLGVIENMTDFTCPHCDKNTKIYPGEGGAEESARLGVPLLGELPLHPNITQSTDSGIPYVIKHKESSITEKYNQIALQIYKIINTSTQDIA